MNKLVILPTWLLMQALRPALPPTHPFKKDISLEQWTDGAQPLCVYLSMLLWAGVFTNGCMLLILILGE